MNENIPVKEQKKHLIKIINKLSRLVIFYELALVLSAIIAVLYYIYAYSFTSLTNELLLLATNGWVYLLGVGIGMIYIFHYYKTTSFKHKIITIKTKMSVSRLLLFIACFLALQFVYQFFINLIENLLNAAGYSIIGNLEEITTANTSVSMFLYVAVVGPIVEEFIFRGIVLRQLEPYGKMFAIIFSSILFGLLHANFYQGVLAALTGLLLGYIALEYSIVYSIALHIINNMLFGELLGRLDSPIITWALLALFAICLLLAIIFTALNLQKIKQYIQKNRTLKSTYKIAFSSLFFILFALLNIALSFISISKL
jgi:hypothetical protein